MINNGLFCIDQVESGENTLLGFTEKIKASKQERTKKETKK